MSASDLSPALSSAVSLALAVLPVLAFLAALVALDSYKLVRLRVVLKLVALGFAIGLAALYLNDWLRSLWDLDRQTFSRYLAPVAEEIYKGAVVFVAIQTRRIGFLVDAAIWGFAIGAGFAVRENLFYFQLTEEQGVAFWVVRGFGTAVMHGGATSILAVLSRMLTDRFESRTLPLFLPGLLLAAACHSFFNHFYLSPSLSTAALVIGLPLLFVGVFEVSERATHQWLGAGFDDDQELLATINRGAVSTTRIGRYLKDLRKRFPPETVIDMICLIRIHLELSIRAKGVLLAKRSGFSVPPDPRVLESLEEMRFLEKSVGRTGRLAMAPIFSQSSRDLWQIHTVREG